jgi:hypothetical protein
LLQFQYALHKVPLLFDISQSITSITLSHFCLTSHYCPSRTHFWHQAHYWQNFNIIVSLLYEISLLLEISLLSSKDSLLIPSSLLTSYSLLINMTFNSIYTNLIHNCLSLTVVFQRLTIDLKPIIKFHFQCFLLSIHFQVHFNSNNIQTNPTINTKRGWEGFLANQQETMKETCSKLTTDVIHLQKETSLH